MRSRLERLFRRLPPTSAAAGDCPPWFDPAEWASRQRIGRALVSGEDPPRLSDQEREQLAGYRQAVAAHERSMAGHERSMRERVAAEDCVEDE